MKPVFKLPTPQPPRPSPADLAPLVAIYEEADRAGSHHWQVTQRNGLLHYAIEFLRAGQWDRAEDNCEKALKREEEAGGDYAARFAEVLIKLKDKATHKSNGAALKVSLKVELSTKKETPHGITNGTNSGVEVAQEESQPEHLAAPRQAQRGDLDAVHRASGVATPSPRTEAEPHPFAVAATKIELIKSYWGAIAEHVPGDIILLTKQCKHVGLDEVYKETVWQLANRDLHQAHKRARQIAVEAWEGAGNE
jgi:hypothetical protein